MKAIKRYASLTTELSSYILKEPLGPIVKTKIPGPKAESLLGLTKEFSQDFRTVKKT